jgi:eukaryotic-like serine/threonine-protein kinase
VAVTIGTQLGTYEITALLGKVGMGEVYRARDTKLKREVAIKILPDEFSSDAAGRVSRFQREAEVLASLNHPNIAAIYDLQKAGDKRFLVLELVEGETLAERIARGALPLEEASAIARQVAEALEAAHEIGIVHRDLKPANIKITRDGTVKVLDFGLAKVRQVGNVDPSEAATNLTVSKPGMILGTPAYMSPEQASGRPCDRTSDVWAFGCVMYEMLAGRRAFEGENATEILAGILKGEPDWNHLPPPTAEAVRRLLRRCLEKNDRRRLRDFRDIALEIDDARQSAQNDRRLSMPIQEGRQSRAWMISAGVTALITAVLVVMGFQVLYPQHPDSSVYRSSINLPDGTHFPFSPTSESPAGRFALSPDGRRLAFIAKDSKRTMLWVRQLDTLAAQPLEGTEGAAFPFWSPDSRFIAFLAQGQLKKVAAAGGVPFRLCEAALSSTGAWNRDDVILFTPPGGSPLYRVPAAGGTPVPVTTLNAGEGDVQHWYPSFLPDGRRFIYSALRSKTGAEPRAIYVSSLDSKEPGSILLEGPSNAKYAKGYLLFARGNTLMAASFDAARLKLLGQPVALAAGLQTSVGSATGTAGAFSVSENDVLVYQTGLDAVRSQLGWFDRYGHPIRTLGEPADYGDVNLSPDGRRAAVSVLDPERGTRDIWIFDENGRRERFTFDSSNSFSPVWSPAGNTLAFSSQGTNVDIYQKNIRGSDNEHLVLGGDFGKFAEGWSRDGRFLLYVFGGAAFNRSDIWALPLFGDNRPFEVIQTPFVENQPRFSPDARWIAYTSNKSGNFEIYVASFPKPIDEKIISVAGGMWPRWSRDGKELFYLAPNNTLTVVALNIDGSSVTAGTARQLFQLHPRPQVRLDAYPYDVSPDGQRILVNSFLKETASKPITLVVRWTAEVRK